MNRDHYEKKFQQYFAKVKTLFDQALATESVTHPSEESLTELQGLQTELKKKVGNDEQSTPKLLDESGKFHIK